MKSRYDSRFLVGLGSGDKIYGIQEWAATEKDSFDTEFVDDLEEKLDEYGELTEAQDDALDRIICSWKIPAKYFS